MIEIFNVVGFCFKIHRALRRFRHVFLSEQNGTGVGLKGVNETSVPHPNTSPSASSQTHLL